MTRKFECEALKMNAGMDPARRMRATRQRGFTLVHLLGVIALLAIPATILFPIIATPAPGEIKADDMDAVSTQDRASFINTIRGTQTTTASLDTQLAVFRTWAKESQGANITYGARGQGQTMVARYDTPSCRSVALNRAKRLHWYYAYLRRSYLPKTDCIVVVEDKQGRTLATCRGAADGEHPARIFGFSWRRWTSAGLPFTQSMHHAVTTDFQRFVAATHRL